MAKLDDVPRAGLQDALDDCTSAKAAKRLVVALAYKDGVSVATLTARYGIAQSTIYSWLSRFEERPIGEAIRDEGRPGRPRELPKSALAELTRVLDQPPGAVGRDEEEWTAAALREYIESAYGVEYSLGHTRRLLDELSAR